MIRISQVEDKVDTIKKVECMERLHHIYGEGNNYEYIATFANNDSSILHKSFLRIQGSNRIREDAKSQTLIDIFYERFENDSIIFQSHLGNSSYSKWVDSYSTGVIENETRVFIHPIQTNQFIQTEIAGMPSVHFPLSIGNNWTATTTIFEGWGDWNNSTVSSEFVVEELIEFKILNEQIECWKIQCISNFNDEQNTLLYLFHEDYGFVYMLYHFSNGNVIEFKLIDFEKTIK